MPMKEEHLMARDIPSKPVFPAAGSPGSLDLREYFAAMALQGLLAGVSSLQAAPLPADAVRKAIEYADALIAALE
jgi:hypothetical protein